jgi:hypothetical protein
MKHCIEIDLPEGFSVKTINSSLVGKDAELISIHIEKKNIKNFDFYVDEYLRSDDFTTNDMLCNWFDKDQLEKIGNNLKQNKLQFVPWEVKIGLLKFICKDKHVSLRAYLYPRVTDVDYQICTDMDGLFSQYFKDELLK